MATLKETELLELALKNCQEAAEKGYKYALENVKHTTKAIKDSETVILETLASIEQSNINSEDLLEKIREQLNIIVIDLSTLQQKVEYDLKQRKKHLSTFNISLFGRTMAGKSTIMEILTKGNGKSIGKGAQRTTKDVRSYFWKGLKVTDVPGIAAFEGAEDESIAFEAASKADYVLFLITDDGPQEAEAECLARVKKLGKPILGICNVKVATEDSDDLMLFLHNPKAFFAKERLNELKGQFLTLAEKYLPDIRIPFVDIHAHSRFLAEQPNMAKHSDELIKASNFLDLERRIITQVSKNGRFYRFKTFIDAAIVPMIDLSNQLLEFREMNSSTGRILKKKRDQLLEWKIEFKKNGSEEIEKFANNIINKLNAEIPAFAEDHYSNKSAEKEWEKLLKSFQFDDKASKLIEKLYKQSEQQLTEYLRELNSEIGLVSVLKSQQFRVLGITDTRRIARWGITGVSGAITIAGVFIVALGGGWVPLAVGVGIGLLGAFFDWITDSRESKVAKARASIESQLRNHTEKLSKNIQRQMLDIFHEQLIKKNIEPVIADLQIIISALFRLADTQRNLADIMLHQQLELNRTLLVEALHFLDMSGHNHAITKNGRLPGFAVVLLIDKNTRLPDTFKRDMEQLLGERVLYVIDTSNNYSIIRQLLKRKLGDQVKIGLEEKIRVAHVKQMNELDEEGKQLCLLAQQLTGFHVMA